MTSYELIDVKNSTTTTVDIGQNSLSIRIEDESYLDSLYNSLRWRLYFILCTVGFLVLQVPLYYFLSKAIEDGKVSPASDANTLMYEGIAFLYFFLTGIFCLLVWSFFRGFWNTLSVETSFKDFMKRIFPIPESIQIIFDHEAFEPTISSKCYTFPSLSLRQIILVELGNEDKTLRLYTAYNDKISIFISNDRVSEQKLEEIKDDIRQFMEHLTEPEGFRVSHFERQNEGTTIEYPPRLSFKFRSMEIFRKLFFFVWIAFFIWWHFFVLNMFPVFSAAFAVPAIAFNIAVALVLLVIVFVEFV